MKLNIDPKHDGDLVKGVTLFKSVSLITIWLKCKYLPRTTTGAPRWVQAQLGYCREALQVRGVVGGFGLILFFLGGVTCYFKCQEKPKDIRYYLYLYILYMCIDVLNWTHYYKLMIWLDAGFLQSEVIIHLGDMKLPNDCYIEYPPCYGCYSACGGPIVYKSVQFSNERKLRCPTHLWKK